MNLLITFFLLIISLSSNLACFKTKAKRAETYTYIKINNNNLEIAQSLFDNKTYKKCIDFCLSKIETTSNSKNEIEYLKLIANSYNALNDYYNSIYYYEKLIYKTHKKNPESNIKNYIEIAHIHRKLEDQNNLDKAIFYLKLAESHSNSKTLDFDTLYSINNNLGGYYMLSNRKKEALKHYNKALEYIKSKGDLRRLQINLINLGMLSSNGVTSTQQELELSKKYYQRALDINIPTHFSVLYKLLGINSYLQDNPESALIYHNKAIDELLNTNLKTPKQLPHIDKISNENKKKLLSILYEKYYAWIKYFIHTKDKKHLNHASETLELSDLILDDIFTEIKDEDSQIHWRQEASYFYYLGAHLSHLTNNTTKAFYYTEKNKALLLLNNATRIRIQNNLSLPKIILDTENNIKKESYALKRLIKNKANDSIRLLLVNKKEQLKKLKDSLQFNYPEYDNYQKISKVLTLNEIQNQITDSTLYITFIWDKTENQFDALYGVAITKHSSEIFKINNLTTFNQLVKQFQKSISKPFSNKEKLKQFKLNAFKLYDKLFPTQSIKTLINKHKKLIIIPDSDLSKIPFEALITDLNANSFLIKSHEISYAYSLSFLTKNNSLERSAKKDFLGFAPTIFNYDNLQNLPESKNEIKATERIINGKNYLSNNATKQAFLSEMNKYKIIHLSTHANANDSISPWIAFKNQKLYLNELYTTKNQAELVVLNACNSSMGELNNGEGVFSLARGFFYSGAKSVISSLWNVNDKSNTEITLSFYQHLKNGKSKSAALRNAKLDYLAVHSLSEASPYYWSSLILIGDDSVIKLNNDSLYYIILSVLLLILLFFILKKRK